MWLAALVNTIIVAISVLIHYEFFVSSNYSDAENEHQASI